MSVNEYFSSPIVKVAAVVIILAGLVAAKSIIIPILLAIFITILTSPFLIWLQDKGFPHAVALIGIIAMLVVIMTLLGMLISSSLHDFSLNLPQYEQKLRNGIGAMLHFAEQQGFELPRESIVSMVNPSKIAQYVSGFIKGFGAALTNGFMILLLVIFMLLEVSTFPKKMEAIHADASDHASEFLTKIKQYMLIKSIFSFFTGVLVYISMLFIGLDYALLWGVLAFLLNYVPNIGSILAAVPAVLLALIQLGVMGAVEVAIVFVVVNVILGSVLEPKYMGQGLGLSTLVVFVSLIFWGWMFGPVGMLLSIPLTIVVKLAFEVNPKTQWISVLLGSGESH
jgi:AI-2 transport protein TqsA